MFIKHVINELAVFIQNNTITAIMQRNTDYYVHFKFQQFQHFLCTEFV